ncbi:MAG: histidine phosphatase family protein [Gammaproteobacteria bacterium]|nr:histidine phosphatase family protein [Gammaproteobacteria bacterium]
MTDSLHGERTTALIDGLWSEGIRRMTLLMRHSAREYAPGKHDLANPLTEEGRRLAHLFGTRLRPELALRAYASPVARCEDTAELIHAAHRERGGRGRGGARPVEGLGVFYVLDQMKMFKAMSTSTEGMGSFVRAWLDGRVPEDIMLPAELAARSLLKMLTARLATQEASPALDICVSHDLTLYLMREVCLGLSREQHGDVLYLDGMVVFERDGDWWAATHDQAAKSVGALLGVAAAIDARMG